MEMYQIDIPFIHLPNRKGVEFIRALNSTENVDMFLTPAV